MLLHLVHFFPNRSFIIAILLATFFVSNSNAQGTKSHLSSDKIFILTYPDEWKKASIAGTTGEVTLNAPGQGLVKYTQVNMAINEIDAAYKGYSLKELAEVELKMLKATSKQQLNLEVIESNFKTINNKEWWVVYGKMTQGKQVYMTNIYKTIHSGKVYVLNYYSIEKNFEKYVPDALKMVETLDFLTKDATVYNNVAKPGDKTSSEGTKVANALPVSTKPKQEVTKEIPIKNPNETLPSKTQGATGKVTFKYAGKTVTYTTVRAADGNVWLQQSLGSKKVASDLFDKDAMGDLFQWGRWADGHQVRKPANTRNGEIEPNNPSVLNKNGTNPFFYNAILGWWVGSESDTWASTSPSNVTATNGCDPCKAMGNGWRLPTVSEWEELQKKEFITDENGGFLSSLKLSAEGYRDAQTALLNDSQVIGVYWTSSPGIGFAATKLNRIASYFRGTGLSIRCIRGVQ